ncbi:MAG: cation:proton antiporter [Deltaproteobacteria bacterium]|nr:cation:proton antiporter [Deltaproteobacteria bacterium]
MHNLGERQLLSFLLEVAALVAVARLFADLLKRLGQPGVAGYLLAGLALGPSCLGRLWPQAGRWLIAPDPVVGQLVEGVAWLSVVLVLVEVGLESDPAVWRNVAVKAAAVSAAGMAAALGCGLALGMELPLNYLGRPDQRLIFAFYTAVALGISAVPVIARILNDLDLIRRDLGMTILGAGMIDDFTGWLLLSLITGLAVHGAVNLRTLALTVGAAVSFVVFCWLAGFRLVVSLLRWVNDRSVIEHSTLSVVLVVGLGAAAMAQALGTNLVFGALLGGLMLGRSARVRGVDRNELSALVSGFCAPLFFAYSGLKVDLWAISSPGLVLLVLLGASASKIAGCAGGGLLSGLGWREALVVAAGMNARGGMGVVAALLGLSHGVLSAQMYALLVVVAVATSILSPPLLSRMLRGVERSPEEIERLERERLLAGLPFSKEGTKLLVLAGGGPNAELAAQLAAALGNHHEASITILHVRRAAGPSSAEVDALLARLGKIAGSFQAPHVYQREIAADAVAEAIVQESRRAYTSLFMGATEYARHGTLGGELLREVIGASGVPVVVTRYAGGPLTFRKVLAPVTGTAYSRLGATLAMLCAHAMGAAVTVLYVAERPSWTLGLAKKSCASLALGRAVLDQMSAVGTQLGVEVSTQLAESARVERAILRLAEQGGFDLLFLGALSRSVKEHLYFGPKIEWLLRRAKGNVAVAVLPEKSLPYA